uniref:ADP-ribosylglycohydrolase n=1 Tax=Tetradesmus obliquus TaxID=3088 RepID=A0A383VKV4_TETOB|eukprot:jgi/Sobl393_1/4173/SZX65563.1
MQLAATHQRAAFAAPRTVTVAPRSVSTAATAPAAQGSMGPAATRDRAKGAVVGALVADAATMGLHWIYDQGKLQQLLASKGKQAAPEFFDPPSCPFYEMPSGSLSPYGGELHALLRYMSQPALAAAAASKAPLDGPSWAAALAGYFKDVYAGYKNKSVKSVIANIEAGKAYPATGDAEDTQANSLCKLPLIAAVYAGSPELPAAVEASIRAQQNNDASVTMGLAAAKILEKVILGSSIDEALAWAQQQGNLPPAEAQLVSAALAAKGEPFNTAAQKFGVACSMPGAFQNALLAAAGANSYSDGIRTNMMAGGDNCSRSVYLGALLGAAYGVEGVPQEWRAKVTGWPEMEAAIDAVVV